MESSERTMAEMKDTQSIGDLVARLASDTSTLLRQEVQLAKVELSRKAADTGKHVGMIAVGGGVAYAGLLAIVAALILFLGEYMPFWVSALVTGIVVGGIGYYFARRQLEALQHVDPVARATVETMKENKEWAKEQLR
jgi:uncharacterized membrane protein YqjE